MNLRFIDKRMFRYIDWFMFANIVLLILFSFVAIANAVSDSVGETDSLFGFIAQLDLYYVLQQLTWFFIGLLAMFVVLLPDYHAIGDYYKWIYVILIVLLVAVFFLGSEENGTKGWFKFGSASFQPSELGKIAIIITLARMISNQTAGKEGGIKKVKDILPIIGVFLVPFALIMIQPDWGTAFVYAFTFFSMLFVAKTSLKLIGGMFACIGIGAPLAWLVMEEWQRNRIYTFIGIKPTGMESEEFEQLMYQSDTAKAAAGSGQFGGKGLFSSELSNIPFKRTDFIFASTTEAIGFIGAALILVVYFVLIMRMLYLATKAKDEYGRLVIVGVLAMTLFHIFENVGMNMGVMPITGIPLPLLSYGGSNLLTNMIAFGLVINVSMRRHRWGLANTG